ncbi:DUF4262 domain-containing protein [Candidatus Rhodobacter oscarellae]|uniref:DUF4262 domain-containing protein n=1 Tax=Candidatus Rhodobacter oscarellae TaxID=1675527 RepID=UPI0006710A9D|nr:DUF4262 domain-containing protein [Candidatus Rhodobacter lobularis]
MRADGITAFDLPEDAYERGDADFLARIREHGWTMTNVFTDASGPGFSYTTGFDYSKRGPEVVFFGLPPDAGSDMGWTIWEFLEAQDTLPVGRFIDGILTELPVVFLPVPKKRYAEHLGWSRWFYAGDAFDCLQMVIPDACGKFPWQPGVDATRIPEQTDLTERNWLGHPPEAA